jgi:glutamate/tyrosine decarboxylase-like PLP-dependent enzyme
MMLSKDESRQEPASIAKSRQIGEKQVAAQIDSAVHRQAASNMTPAEFRSAGHRLVDALADFYADLRSRPLTPGESVADLERVIEPTTLPHEGRSAEDLLAEVTPMLFEHSLHNGHPLFLGYITSAAAPLGALADLLAAGINQNCGLRDLAPAANAIEQQAIGWLAELIGYPTDCGGIMVSGGNVANLLGFLAARRAKLGPDVRAEGLRGATARPRIYASRQTHTWIEKAADVSGLGTSAIRWIDTDSEQRVDPAALEAAIIRDREAGELPMLVVGTAGNVSTGAIDPLDTIGTLAERHGLWFHVDGAYGAPAACLPESPAALHALARADSVALDPHKWLYVPVEAACTLVRARHALRDAFSYRPDYYRLDDDARAIDYYEHGLQNSRAFRALKVWLGLRQAGRAGIEQQIRQDIALAVELYEQADAHAELEACTQHLSITTFRYRPLAADGSDDWNSYLDELNASLLARLQKSGAAYLSNAKLGGHYFLRACVVNFHTESRDIETLIDIVVRLGRELDRELRRGSL